MKKLNEFLKKYWPLLLILITATFLRFYQLSTLPPGLHPDEAANGLDIINMIEHHQFAAIYDTNGPREALFFYFQAIFVWIGKITGWTALNFTPLSLRIAPAIIGALTVWGTYLLGKELFCRNVGLFASAAMAVSAWHIQFSRNGFRAIVAPLALVFLFYFFIKAYKTAQTKYYVFTGIALASGFYTYLSFRMTPLILAALGVYILIEDKNFVQKYWKNILYLAAAFLIVMIPMFVHFYHVPADLAGRSSVSIFNKELNNGSPIKTFGGNILKTAGMFNFKGDANFRQNLGDTPMLDPIVGILLWLGVIIILFNLLKIEYFLLLMWAGAMALPELLTAEGIPHALRIVGIMPVVFLAVGIGLDWLINKLKWQKFSEIVVILLLIASGSLGFYKYFIAFPALGASGEAYAEDMVGIANDINQADSSRENLLIIGEYGSKTVEYITHATGHNWARFEARDVNRLLVLPDGSYKIFVQKDWYDQTKSNLETIGFIQNLSPVKSKIDGRVIYYEYQKD
jgi:4-amino-4-deoxy-L-arabinose transferase-like glycosyltransferase